MIVVILAGGLGNQMFEYAAGRAMALRNSTRLVLNTRIGFERDKFYHRVYCLDAFNIDYIKRRIISFDIPFGSFLDKLSRKIGFHILCPWYKYLRQDRINKNNILKPLKSKNVILLGGWISQDYFEDFKPQIRKDFEFKIKFPPVVDGYVQSILSTDKPTIAMGVRIYQEIKKTEMRNGRYFYTREAFYNEALEYMKSKIGEFKLLIFTQAEEWVRKNVDLKEIDYSFVKASHDDKDAINDIYIMSKCSHYIISNSTFYFWGCWLNQNDKKIVVVPKKWEDCPLEGCVIL